MGDVQGCGCLWHLPGCPALGWGNGANPGCQALPLWRDPDPPRELPTHKDSLSLSSPCQKYHSSHVPTMTGKNSQQTTTVLQYCQAELIFQCQNYYHIIIIYYYYYYQNYYMFVTIRGGQFPWKKCSSFNRVCWHPTHIRGTRVKETKSAWKYQLMQKFWSTVCLCKFEK